jgi:hypothetical protein
LGVVFGLLSVHFYFRGLLKTLILFFLVYYPIMFALPDIRMGRVRMGTTTL